MENGKYLKRHEAGQELPESEWFPVAKGTLQKWATTVGGSSSEPEQHLTPNCDHCFTTY